MIAIMVENNCYFCEINSLNTLNICHMCHKDDFGISNVQYNVRQILRLNNIFKSNIINWTENCPG